MKLQAERLYEDDVKVTATIEYHKREGVVAIYSIIAENKEGVQIDISDLCVEFLNMDGKIEDFADWHKIYLENV